MAYVATRLAEYPGVQMEAKDDLQKSFIELLSACKLGKPELLKNSLIKINSLKQDEPISKLMRQDQYKDSGLTAIHLAARYGYSACLTILLHAVKDDLTILREKTPEGMTPLMLLSIGETPWKRIPEKWYKIIPVNILDNEVKKVIETLKEKVENIEALNQFSRELVEACACNWHTDINSFYTDVCDRLEKLKQMDLKNIQTSKESLKGIFPIDVLYDHKRSMEILLSKNYIDFIDLHAVDSKGMNALYYAILGDEWTLFQILRAHGLNIIEVGKDTLIHHAAEFGRTICVEMLLTEKEYSECYLSCLINGATDSKGLSIIHNVIKRCNLEDNLETLRLIIQILKRNNYDVKRIFSQKCNGFNPLHLATELSYVSAVKILLDEKVVDTNSKTDSGETAAHLAAQNGDVEILELLSEYGADISIKNANGESSLDLLRIHETTEKLEEIGVKTS